MILCLLILHSAFLFGQEQSFIWSSWDVSVSGSVAETGTGGTIIPLSGGFIRPHDDLKNHLDLTLFYGDGNNSLHLPLVYNDETGHWRLSGWQKAGRIYFVKMDDSRTLRMDTVYWDYPPEFIRISETDDGLEIRLEGEYPHPAGRGRIQLRDIAVTAKIRDREERSTPAWRINAAPSALFSGSQPLEALDAAAFLGGLLATENAIDVFHTYLHSQLQYSGSRNLLQTPSAVLLRGNASCEGYARSAEYLGRKSGIPILYVSGTFLRNGVLEEHAWNMVYHNGGWYAADFSRKELLFVPAAALHREYGLLHDPPQNP